MRIFFTFLLLFAAMGSQAQIKVVLVRHSVKSDNTSRDPDLSAEGKNYAEALGRFLENESFDGAYATPFKRTHQTIEKVAVKNQLAIRDYPPVDGKGLLAKIQESGQKSVIVAGHSNTIHHLINYFVPEAKMEELDESDYGKVFLISYYGDRPASLFVLNTKDWIK